VGIELPQSDRQEGAIEEYRRMALMELMDRPAAGHPLRVELVGDEEARAEVKAALMAVDDPPLEIVEVTRKVSRASDQAAPADVTMAILNGDENATLEYLRSHAERSERPILFALLHERSAAAMRRALQAGADELLFLPLDIGQVTRALLKVNEVRRKADRQVGGVVCSLASNVGGVGVTSLVVNLAFTLLNGFKKRVALIDLHLQTGGLAVALDLEVRRSIMDICDPDKPLDSMTLESALTKHPSGLYLLAAPRRIEDSELVPEQTIADVLNLMRQLFDFVLVDCGSYMDGKVVTAWERSDHLFYVLDQSVGAVRCAGRFVALLGRLGLPRVEPAFILNKYAPDHVISEEQIIQSLGAPIYVKLPRDAGALERAQLSSKDLWQVGPGSPLARAVRELAAKLASEDEASEPANGLVSRLLSAVGMRA
jgi:pilus assembly protein CpaE